MIELLFVACLQTQPEACREQSLVFAENISPMACLMGAQPELVKWCESHPGWVVAEWKCQALSDRLAEQEA